MCKNAFKLNVFTPKVCLLINRFNFIKVSPEEIRIPTTKASNFTLLNYPIFFQLSLLQIIIYQINLISKLISCKPLNSFETG